MKITARLAVLFLVPFVIAFAIIHYFLSPILPVSLPVILLFDFLLAVIAGVIVAYLAIVIKYIFRPVKYETAGQYSVDSATESGLREKRVVRSKKKLSKPPPVKKASRKK